MAIAPDASLSKPRWAPDERSMSYLSNAGYGAQTRAVIALGFGHVAVPWTGDIGGHVENGMPWSPDGRHLAILTATDGVIVADAADKDSYKGSLRRLGHVADCWIEWSPDSSALYGGSPGDCDHVVVIPLSDPSCRRDIAGVGLGRGELAAPPAAVTRAMDRLLLGRAWATAATQARASPGA